MPTMNACFSRARCMGLAIACVLAAPVAQARPTPSALTPGEYVTEGGWGVLTLRTEADKRLLFELEAAGANGHSCSLDGEIRNGRTTLSDTPEPAACVVRFVANGSAIEVSTTEGASCRAFCGTRAGFTGRYVRTAPGCDSLSRGATGADFKRLYENGAYREAQQQASRLLERCTGTMTWTERARLLNDLAITQYHLGLFEACVRTLQPLADDAASSNRALMDRLPPTDYETYLPIVESTRNNLRWCQASQRRQ